RRHNLYRDSIVLTNSDPNLHLLGENSPIDWAEEYGGGQEEVDGENAGDPEAQKRRRMKQVVSMIHIEGNSSMLPNESCLEVPAVSNIPEEEPEVRSDNSLSQKSEKQVPNGTKEDMNKNAVDEKPPTNGSAIKEEESTTEKLLQGIESKSAIDCAIQEIDNAVQEEEHKLRTQKTAESSSSKEETAAGVVEPTLNCEPINQADANKDAPLSTEEKPLDSPVREVEAVPPPDQQENHITASTQDSHMETSSSPSQHDDSGFQSPANEAAEEEHQTEKEECNDSETGEDTGKGESAHMDH
ncbi:hypothetical protein M9458_011786, partial [Cirrhinus mrigala]